MFFRVSAVITSLLWIVLISSASLLYAAGNQSAVKDPPRKQSIGQPPECAPMLAPGKKVRISDDYYLIYGFDHDPKIGIAILKVQVYTKTGEKTSSLKVFADSGMPSMRGAHDTGDRPMQLSRKHDYLLPIDIVMPGEWEVRIKIKRAGKLIFQGNYRFDV